MVLATGAAAVAGRAVSSVTTQPSALPPGLLWLREWGLQ